MIKVNKLKINPISQNKDRFDTNLKTYKRLFLLIVVFFIISIYFTAISFDKHLKEDRVDFKELITNYTTIK